MPFALTAQAAVNVNFDFTRSGADGLYNTANGKYTSDPITVDDLTLTIATTDDWWNSTGLEGGSDGLIILAEDGLQMTFTFDKAVRITGFVTETFATPAGDEEIRFSWGTSGSYTEKSYSQGENRTTTLATQIELAAGEALTIRSFNPVWQEGVHMKSLQVTVVPEPAVYALVLGLLALGGVGVRRYRGGKV